MDDVEPCKNRSKRSSPSPPKNFSMRFRSEPPKSWSLPRPPSSVVNVLSVCKMSLLPVPSRVVVPGDACNPNGRWPEDRAGVVDQRCNRRGRVDRRRRRAGKPVGDIGVILLLDIARVGGLSPTRRTRRSRRRGSGYREPRGSRSWRRGPRVRRGWQPKASCGRRRLQCRGRCRRGRPRARPPLRTSRPAASPSRRRWTS